MNNIAIKERTNGAKEYEARVSPPTTAPVIRFSFSKPEYPTITKTPEVRKIAKPNPSNNPIII
jgi:hypothetical protein